MKRLTLFNIENQSFQVFPFGMINIYRMVGRLVKLMQNAYFAPCLCSSCEDGLPEVVLCYNLRAAESEENSAGFDSFKTLEVQSCISTQSVLQSLSVFGKGRRVEDDEIILSVVIVKILEGILTDSFMSCVTWEVELDIPVCQFYGLGRAVHRVYQLSPASHGID